jgi:plasmid stabilization system protein ParE
MTLRLDAGTLRRLEALARATDRSRAWLAAHGVRTYLDLNEWQVQAVRTAVERADRRGTPYLLPYRIKSNEVEILRVLHAAQKWPER